MKFVKSRHSLNPFNTDTHIHKKTRLLKTSLKMKKNAAFSQKKKKQKNRLLKSAFSGEKKQGFEIIVRNEENAAFSEIQPKPARVQDNPGHLFARDLDLRSLT